MSTTPLRPDHDTTPHCDLCGADDVSLATLPVQGIARALCVDCETSADPIDACPGCGLVDCACVRS